MRHLKGRWPGLRGSAPQPGAGLLEPSRSEVHGSPAGRPGSLRFRSLVIDPPRLLPSFTLSQSARTEEVQSPGGQARQASPQISGIRPIGAWKDDSRFDTDLGALESLRELAAAEPDWFAPPAAGEEAYAARQEVPLAAMLMLGENAWQRIDGMGLARQALEAPAHG